MRGPLGAAGRAVPAALAAAVPVRHTRRRRHAGTLPAAWFWPLFVTVGTVGVWLVGALRAAVGTGPRLALLLVWTSVPRALTGLGAISYSLYLVHVPAGGRVVNLGARLPDHVVVHLGVLTAAVFASLATAIAFWWAVERPSQKPYSQLRYRPPRVGSHAADGVSAGAELARGAVP